MSRSRAPKKSSTRWFARLAVVGLAVAGVQLVGTAVADAHTNDVTGVAACAQNGTYTVTWTIHNTWNSTDSVTVNSHTPDAIALVPDTLELAATGTPGDSGQMVQTGIPAGTATATINIHGFWAADNTTVAETPGSVDLSNVCPPAPPSHQPVAPSSANGGCLLGVVTQPTITINADNGVSYTLDSKPVTPGTHVVTPGLHHVAATSTIYTLTAPTAWAINVTASTGNCATTIVPVTPSVTQSACNGSTLTAPTLGIASTKGVLYTVSASAPYKAGQKVVVTASALPGYAWAASLPAGWHAISKTIAQTTIVFADTSCAQSASVVKPGFTSAVCEGGSTPTAGTFTVPSTTGVSYQVNGNTKKAGTYTAPWGSTVTVVAVAKPGYKLAGRTVWQRSFPTAQYCADQAAEHTTVTPQSNDNNSATTPATPVTPTLASTGAPTGSLLLGGIAAIVLGAMLTMLASRRRQDDAV